MRQWNVQVCRIIRTRLENREYGVRCAGELWDSERGTRVEQRDISFASISSSHRDSVPFPLSFSLFYIPPFRQSCIWDSQNNLFDCHIRHPGTVRTRKRIWGFVLLPTRAHCVRERVDAPSPRRCENTSWNRVEGADRTQIPQGKTSFLWLRIPPWRLEIVSGCEVTLKLERGSFYAFSNSRVSQIRG